MTKKCRNCGEEKDLPDDFYMCTRTRKDGTKKKYPRAWCKECEKERVKGVKERNPALKTWHPKTKNQQIARRTYQREYYRICRGKGHHTWKKYRPRNEREVVPIGPLADWLAGTGLLEQDRLYTQAVKNPSNEIGSNSVESPWSSRSRDLLRTSIDRGTITLDAADKLLSEVGRPDVLTTLYEVSFEPSESEAA